MDNWEKIIHGEQRGIQPVAPMQQATQQQPQQVMQQQTQQLVLSGSGITGQPNTTKALATFWAVSESAIVRWCKGVGEIWGERPVSPFDNEQLERLAQFGMRCSDQWADFRGKTGLAKRLSPTDMVQSLLASQGRSAGQQLQQKLDGNQISRTTAADLQDATSERLQSVEDQLSNHVSAMHDRQFSRGHEIGQQAKAVLSGESLMAGFIAGVSGNDGGLGNTFLLTD